MAERAPITARRGDLYVPERDNPEAMAMQEEVRRRYDETMAPYREMKQAAIQRAYDETLRRTGSEDAARRTADAVAARMSRTETLASFAIPEAAISGAGKVLSTARNVLGGMRGRNAMTAEEALTPTNRLVVDRPASGGYSGSGYNAGPFEQVPFKPNYASGAQMERMPTPPRPDVRSVPDELAVLEGEGGATADAVEQARRIAQERLAAERGFRETQLATMEGEGGGAEALRAAQQRAREAEQAFLERQMMEAEGEGMGAFASRNRPPPRRFSADQDAAAGFGYTTQFPGTAVAPRYVSSEAQRITGKELVPASGRDLSAIMDRHFGGAPVAAGERAGLPATGPTYRADVPNAGPRLVGESFAGESPAYAFTVTTNRAAQPDWMKRAAAIGGAGALGAGYYAFSRPGEEAPMGDNLPTPPRMGDAEVVAPQQTTGEVQGPPQAPDYGGMGRMPHPSVQAALEKAMMRRAPAAAPAGGSAASEPSAATPAAESRGLLGRVFSGKDYQSMGGELVQDGKINWGDPESAADYFRAADQMRRTQEANQEVRGINPVLERKSGGEVNGKKPDSVHKALEIIHQLITR